MAIHVRYSSIVNIVLVHWHLGSAGIEFCFSMQDRHRCKIGLNDCKSTRALCESLWQEVGVSTFARHKVPLANGGPIATCTYVAIAFSLEFEAPKESAELCEQELLNGKLRLALQKRLTCPLAFAVYVSGRTRTDDCLPF